MRWSAIPQVWLSGFSSSNFNRTAVLYSDSYPSEESIPCTVTPTPTRWPPQPLGLIRDFHLQTLGFARIHSIFCPKVEKT
jgi:hypothetical protein